MDENLTKIDTTSKITRVSAPTDRHIKSFKNQSYEALKNECLKSKRLFEDPLFEPIDRNMFYTQPPPMGVKWKRPKEICSKPQFITNFANVNDLDQGYLGNCWFIAGCAAIVNVPQLFSNVVPAKQECEGPNYGGIFRFHFWYYGQWVEVVIDDRLPVYATGKLVFCNNREEPDEFWAALLEKA
jgi:hypothetical protein